MGNLNAVAVRNERRIRLAFDSTLAAGAFTSTSYYAILCTSNDAANPTVSAAIAIATDPSAVDLALGVDLTPGSIYQVTVTSVPLSPSGTASGTVVYSMPIPTGTVQNVEVSPDDINALLYGVDFIWNGTDYVETGAGDLAVESGPLVVKRDLEAAVLSDGLPWDFTFGAHPRKFVDSPIANVNTLRGRALRTILGDDRVKRADITLFPDVTNGQATYESTVQLIGDGDNITVPLTTSVS